MLSYRDVLTILAVFTLIIPLVLGIIGLIFLFLRIHRRTERLLGRLTATGSAISLAFSFIMMLAPPQDYPLDFYLSLAIVTVDFHLDALSIFFVLLINVIALVASWNDIAYLDGIQPKTIWQEPTLFHTLVNLFHLTMLLVPMVDNLIGIWIAIELTTVGSAFLVAYEGKRSSWEATWKYLIITSTGIILALLGTMFLANAIENPEEQINELVKMGRSQDALMNWTFLMQLAKVGLLQKNFVLFAFLFALAGYGTKAGLAPMHTWLPDGHSEAPSPISALLSGVLLKAAFYAILRFYTLTNTVLENNTITSSALLVVGLLSLLMATPFILRDNAFKRVLAYHSLEHMGIITFGLALGGPIAIFGAVLHTLNHAITKALMFLAFGNVMRQYEKHGIEQKKITGILRSMPFTGGILTVGGLALVGTPPFNIFMSEFIILWGVLSRFTNPQMPGVPKFDDWIVVVSVILFMLSTTFIFFGLIKHLGKLVLNKMPGDQRLERSGWAETTPLVILAILMLLLGVCIVPPLANLINESVKIILGQVI